MTTNTRSPQITMLTDTIADLTEAIARLQAAVVIDTKTSPAIPEAELYRTRLAQSLRSLRVIRAGLVGLQAVLMGQMTP